MRRTLASGVVVVVRGCDYVVSCVRESADDLLLLLLLFSFFVIAITVGLTARIAL